MIIIIFNHSLSSQLFCEGACVFLPFSVSQARIHNIQRRISLDFHTYIYTYTWHPRTHAHLDMKTFSFSIFSLSLPICLFHTHAHKSTLHFFLPSTSPFWLPLFLYSTLKKLHSDVCISVLRFIHHFYKTSRITKRDKISFILINRHRRKEGRNDWRDVLAKPNLVNSGNSLFLTSSFPSLSFPSVSLTSGVMS